MKFLTVQEFQALSEPEKSDYYEKLLAEREISATADQLAALAVEFFNIDYMDSREIAIELKLEAEKLYQADRDYAKERRKKGLLVSFIVICAAVIVASAVVIIGLF